MNDLSANGWFIGAIILVIIIIIIFYSKYGVKEGYEKNWCHFYGSPYDLYTGGYGNRWGYYGSNPLGNKQYAPQVGSGMCGSYRCPYMGCGKCYGCGNMAGSSFKEARICGMNQPCLKAGKCGIEKANY